MTTVSRITNADLEEALELNLSQYVEANSSVIPSDYKIKRELNVARYALSESLQLHKVVTDTLKAQLATSSPQQLLSLISALEERSAKLAQNAKTVASVAKMGAEIEMMLSSKLDAAQIYSIIAQLPTLLLSLLQSTLLSYFKDRNLSIVNGKVLNVEEVVLELSSIASNAFSSQIEQSVNVLTYKTPQHQESSTGIIESQVVQMLNSVPIGTVLDPQSQEAKTIADL